MVGFLNVICSLHFITSDLLPWPFSFAILRLRVPPFFDVIWDRIFRNILYVKRALFYVFASHLISMKWFEIIKWEMLISDGQATVTLVIYLWNLGRNMKTLTYELEDFIYQFLFKSTIVCQVLSIAFLLQSNLGSHFKCKHHGYKVYFLT